MAPSPTGDGRDRRRGAARRGTLIALLIGAATIYFGFNIAEPYWKYVQLQDAMQQQALVAPSVPDPTIRRRIEGKVTELGLPKDAVRNLRIDRQRDVRIRIETWYVIPVELPGTVKLWRFEPNAEARL